MWHFGRRQHSGPLSSRAYTERMKQRWRDWTTTLGTEPVGIGARTPGETQLVSTFLLLRLSLSQP
jgi:hypothetical protein